MEGDKIFNLKAVSSCATRKTSPQNNLNSLAQMYGKYFVMSYGKLELPCHIGVKKYNSGIRHYYINYCGVFCVFVFFR